MIIELLTHQITVGRIFLGNSVSYGCFRYELENCCRMLKKYRAQISDVYEIIILYGI